MDRSVVAAVSRQADIHLHPHGTSAAISCRGNPSDFVDVTGLDVAS